jgi:hypothetical protein
MVNFLPVPSGPKLAAGMVIRRWVCFLGLAILAVGWTGCQSSGIARRKGERRGVYDALNPATRALVDKGRVESGMDTNAVYIAWGAPDDARTFQLPDGSREVWTYLKDWAYSQSRWVPYGTIYGRPRYVIETTRVATKYASRNVVFINGRVVHWKENPPPVYDVKPPPPAGSVMY